MYKLRPYQEQAVAATIRHFQKSDLPAVLVLPTGAGKSLVIAELARLARGRVLVLAHVKELVEQNHAKFSSLSSSAGIYSAGLKRKDHAQKVIFGSIQSVARAEEDFFKDFSLVIIDECHRISTGVDDEGDTQYQQVLRRLRNFNPRLRVLGLTATPYRLGAGWIYEYHAPLMIWRTSNPRVFKTCVFELTTRQMIREGFLTPPVRIDAPVACYDFSRLKLHGTSYVLKEVERVLADQKRITPVIIANIVDLCADREGVMIFTSSVRHAQEILRLLPPFVSAMVVGETEAKDRDDTIAAFKARQLKYLVNVSVLTTGFDAPHVDVIAILRPTESDSLYQQIVGRGLRLSPGKKDCLILDYTGQAHDIFSPAIDVPRPRADAKLVDVPCPKCGVVNEFWGLVNEDGFVEEHFGRRCQGASQNPRTGEMEACRFLFRFKRCDRCGAENDVSARLCVKCEHVLVDADKKLKEAMSLKDAHVLKVDTMEFKHGRDKKGRDRLEIAYFDVDANVLREYYYLNSRESRYAFYITFARMHLRVPEMHLDLNTVDDVLSTRKRYRAPLFVIARKQKKFWAIREKIF